MSTDADANVNNAHYDPNPFGSAELKPVCIRCKKTPDQIDEYIFAAAEEGITPDQYVRSEEGTYNPSNGHFACTDCYIAIGMPSSRTGWKAP